MKAQSAELERRKALLSERYGEKHPEILTINASIDDANRQLRLEMAKAVDSIRHDYESAMLEERTLASALDEQKTIRDGPRSQERRLHGAAARCRKQSRAVPDAAAPREGAAGPRQQPRQQRPHRRARRQCRQCLSARTFGAVRSSEGWSACWSRSGSHSGSTTSTTRSGRRTTSRGVWDCRSWALIPAVRGYQDRPVLSGSSDFSEAIRALRTSLALDAQLERQRHRARHQRPATRRQDDDGV